MHQDRVTDLIHQAIDEYNAQATSRRPLDASPDTVLLGPDGLDSLGLVRLIIAVEQNALEKLDLSVTLVDEKAMSLNSSPFRTVGTLTEYLAARIQEQLDE